MQADRESGKLLAVPCKLNNVKMTFITLDKYKGCLRLKNSQRKFLSKFARANESEDYDFRASALRYNFLRV